jgi:MFS family permease
MSKHLKEKIRKSLNASWIEGIPAAVMLGIMDNFVIPYGLFLGASPKQIGIMVAVPHLIGSIVQLFAVPAVRAAGNRKRFLVSGAFLHASILLPIAGLVFVNGSLRITFLIILIAMYRVIGNLIGTAWGSLISDYLPSHKRGDYFGWRAQITGMAGLAGIAFSGLFLYEMKKINPTIGFFLLFFAASLCRYFSTYLMTGLMDIHHHTSEKTDFTFYMFMRRFKESNFVKFVLYIAGISFATHVASPYFSVYMLRDLKFNYLTYAAVIFSAVIMGLVAFPIWGRHADVVGNAKILKITSFLIPTVPLLWLLSKNPFFLIMVECYSGFIWCGFNLCATNFIYDAVSPEKRVRCLGYFNLINGIAISMGAFLGGFLADKLPPMGGYRLLTLFFLSGFLRWLAHFLLSPNFREVRDSTHKTSSVKLFFSVVGLRPLAGVDQEWSIFPSEIIKRTFDTEWLMNRLQAPHHHPPHPHEEKEKL